MRRKDKPEKQILYAMQCNYNDIYADMEKVLASKKGYTRSLIRGRFNFCSRVVIVPDPELNIDELGVPYATMIELFQQRIVNILSKTYFPSEAYKIWDRARNIFDPNIANLIESIIQSEYVGVFFNRNPSIASESIRQMRIVKMNYDYACSVPLQILSGFGADFDGDMCNYTAVLTDEAQEEVKKLLRSKAYYLTIDGTMSFSASDDVVQLVFANMTGD
jgi:DNA-directed RNA polymerase beta' subunit